MRVGILGSGLMGGKLGTLFARAGHQVVFSYSRSSQKLEKIAREAGTGRRRGRSRRTWIPACLPPFSSTHLKGRYCA